jgi:L-ascorbate metabolism protein UlaG (beta-lactamase superfamily)
MGPEDAVTAIEFIEPSVVIPIHYNTWPVIDQNAEDFRTLVGDRATVEIVEPGRGVYEF